MLTSAMSLVKNSKKEMIYKFYVIKVLFLSFKFQCVEYIIFKIKKLSSFDLVFPFRILPEVFFFFDVKNIAWS